MPGGLPPGGPRQVAPRIKPGLVGVSNHERDRKRLEATVHRVHLLRNRVAHQEPIFHTNVAQHFADLTDLVRHIDAQAPQWFWEVSRIHELMTKRPS